MSQIYDEQIRVIRDGMGGYVPAADIARFIRALDKRLFALRAEPWHDVPSSLAGKPHRFPAELLIRPFDERGNFSAYKGISYLNKVGFSVPLNKALLIASLEQMGGEPCAFNISSQTAEDASFWQWVRGDLRCIFPGLDPPKTIFELVEDKVASDLPLKDIADLKSDGYRFALDDFTGSDFDRQRLQSLSDIVDFVKIDGSVIEGSAQDPEKLHHVMAVVRQITPRAGIVAERATTVFDSLRLYKVFGIEATQSRTLPESTRAFDLALAYACKAAAKPGL